MILPTYILRRFVAPGGHRLPARPNVDEVAGICPECSKAVVRKKLMGVFQLDGQYYRNDVYHRGCYPTERTFEPTGIHKANMKLRLPKGNMEPEEYRFWIGFEESYASYAICRCCKRNIYGEAGRTMHFKDDTYAVNGERCAVRLVNAYKQIENNVCCLVCKKHRFGHSKWGLPICEQFSCQKLWMFDKGTRYVPLEMALSAQVNRMIMANLKDFEKVQVTDSEGNTKIRPWCRVCRMFADNNAHLDEHAKMMRKGEVN